MHSCLLIIIKCFLSLSLSLVTGSQLYRFRPTDGPSLEHRSLSRDAKNVSQAPVLSFAHLRHKRAPGDFLFIPMNICITEDGKKIVTGICKILEEILDPHHGRKEIKFTNGSHLLLTPSISIPKAWPRYAIPIVSASLVLGSVIFLYAYLYRQEGVRSHSSPSLSGKTREMLDLTAT